MEVSYNDLEKGSIFLYPKTLGTNKAQTLSLFFFFSVGYLFIENTLGMIMT